MTKEEIAAVLADHSRWLRGEGGNRANLTGARLDGADLYGNTVLRILRRATRSDGYEFFLWHCKEGFFIKAGCRFFDMDAARQHWTATRAGTPLGDETQDILDFFDVAITRTEKETAP